jgi:hypothetical protein
VINKIKKFVNKSSNLVSTREKLYVIAPIFNPAGYAIRYELYHKFAKYVEACGGELYTIELVKDDAPFQVTNSWMKNHIQVRSNHVMWHKENLMNVAVRHLPSDWTKVAWIDADITFDKSNWVSLVLAALDNNPIVQLFKHAIDLGPDGKEQYRHTGFFAMYEQFRHLRPTAELKSQMTWHSGYAWACRRDFYNAVGGFIDWGILGAGDRHMATALVGRVEDSLYPGMADNNYHYIMMCKLWQGRAFRFFQQTKQFPSYVPLTLTHYYHGSKKNRQYGTRWKILVDHKFNPIYHIKTDHQGVYQMDARDEVLIAKLIKYFDDRNEDSKDETVPVVTPPPAPVPEPVPEPETPPANTSS